jgi:hypothetical protein
MRTLASFKMEISYYPLTMQTLKKSIYIIVFEHHNHLKEQVFCSLTLSNYHRNPTAL